ncbi:uncharacterized protein [Diabrotica undecimpunctata]|uniref:uncharacterized protein n=1 Tax=Diabrotica undecimpunctata TaxID=50387 RepID=UPI003B63E0AC
MHILRSKVILDRQASTNSSSDTASVENFEMDIDPAGRSLRRKKIEVEDHQSDSSNTVTVSDISISASDISPEKSFSTMSASDTEQFQTENDIPSATVQEKKNKFPYILSKKMKNNSIEEMSSSDFSTPIKRKRIQVLKNTVVCQKRKIQTLQQSVRRLKSRVTSLKKLLKQKSCLQENCETTIKAPLPESVNGLLERMQNRHRNQKYSPGLRSFALTLNFYSTRAYKFVRKTFTNSIPHPTTLSKWYASINGAPGFTHEALTTIRAKANEAKKQNKTIVCNLVFDEMSIRRQP